MTATKTFLFVSIDGMTDPLGQAQVLPYLIGLSKQGYNIGIVSCEKQSNWNAHHSVIESIVKEASITWNYCFYKTGTPFISQQQNYIALKRIVFQQIKHHPGQTILHCRSYLAGLIGLKAKQKFNTGFIFDMRGFWADERVEGGIWKKSNPISSFLYSYFKKKEKEMMSKSDAIISLTHKAKSIILNWGFVNDSKKITVIPCCADLIHFSKKSIDNHKLSIIKEKYPQLKDNFVLSYVGSLGTWYMADEMLAFFKVLSEHKPSLFLIITKDSSDLVYEAAKKQGVSSEQLIIVSAARSEMPYYISLSDASLFFIRPSFSKSASSPTKMGELLSMGVPVVTNAGVGDVDQIVQDTACGVIIPTFTQANYQHAVLELLKNFNAYKDHTVSTANQYFSLVDGVERYSKVYHSF